MATNDSDLLSGSCSIRGRQDTFDLACWQSCFPLLPRMHGIIGFDANHGISTESLRFGGNHLNAFKRCRSFLATKLPRLLCPGICLQLRSHQRNTTFCSKSFFASSTETIDWSFDELFMSYDILCSTTGGRRIIRPSANLLIPIQLAICFYTCFPGFLSKTCCTRSNGLERR